VFIASILISTQLHIISNTYTMASAPSTGSTKVDAVIAKAAASTPEKLSGVQLYSRFATAGAICCSITHGALTPVDV
jgi:solute carrier family 25 phosphate transporter 3